MGELKPLNRFTLTTHSIIDAIFISQNPRRPAYATTTNDSTTTLWTINHRGKLLEVARINWLGEAANRFQPMVTVNGQNLLVDNILQKKQGLFRKPQYSFTAGTVHCRWKRGIKGLGGDFRHFTAISPYPPWVCETAAPSSSTEPPRSRTIAAFFPPHIGPVKAELLVFPNSFDIIDHVLLTAILLTADRNEWRTSQSALSHAALQASIKAEMRGTLPPYTPTAEARYRPSSAENTRAALPPPPSGPPPLRRPQSASAVRTRAGSSVDPTIFGRSARRR